MSKIKGKIALVTGGASGIGKLMGHICLREGAERLVIWDINEAGMEAAAAEMRAEGYTVHTFRCDISDVVSIEAAAEATLAEVHRVDLLINNAGIVAGNKSFLEHTAADIERTMRINVNGHMHVTRMFMPGMYERGNGHIVNIASAAGLTPNRNMSVYAASKWAMLGWSESLRLECEASKGKELHVTTVCPSYISTGMFEGVKEPLLTPSLTPEFIASRVIEAIKHNEILVQEPFTVKLVPLLRGLLPTRVYDFLADEVFGTYDSMTSFKGRSKPS